jgi:predicted nucleotidyltransferase
MFEEIIEQYVLKINEKFDIKGIILFGSVAKGTAKETSDIDLIVVASGLPELRDRFNFVGIKKPARLEAIWMTPDELSGMVDAKTGFVMDALLEGIFLKDDGTIEDSKKKLEESLKKLHAVKFSHGWFIPRNTLNEVISFH